MEYLPWESDGAGLEDYWRWRWRAPDRWVSGRGLRERSRNCARRISWPICVGGNDPADGTGRVCAGDDHAWIDGVIDLVVHDPAARLVRVIDWKTNRLRPGETGEALLARLCEEYRPQLEAYVRARGFFPGCAVRLE